MTLVRDDFAGPWTLHRSIDDRHSAQQGDFRGTATFQKTQSNQLTYLETGHIQFGNGPVLSAHRSYQWLFCAEKVEVLFEDGAQFHSFVAAGCVAGTDHPCGEDYYTVFYDFSDWPKWTATWIVNGPRKDYTSVSQYSREEQDAEAR